MFQFRVLRFRVLGSEKRTMACCKCGRRAVFEDLSGFYVLSSGDGGSRVLGVQGSMAQSSGCGVNSE